MTPDFINADGKIEVPAWTANTIVSHVAIADAHTNVELLLLGLLLQGGAVITLPDNYVGIVPTPPT